MTAVPIIVPIRLDVLAVNEAVHDRDGDLRWWQFNYQALGQFLPAEPLAGQANTGTTQLGVYLHWSLPRALREGARGREQDASIDYPLVPNRWLVIRAQGSSSRTLTAWVVESDCPYSDAIKAKYGVEVGQSSQYLLSPATIEAWQASPDTLRRGIDNIAVVPQVPLDPSANAPQVANIGVAFPQAEWTERDPNATFLTAMAPGNDAFCSYYPHDVGVFSMYDSLDGVDQDDLSYMVVGWYSKPGDDVLADGASDLSQLEAILTRLGWTPSAKLTSATGQSLYQGMALDIAWDRQGQTAPSPDPLEAIRSTPNVDVAIGNSTIDAFNALIGSQLAAKGHPTQTLELLRAFTYDLLPLINQVNGPALLDEAIRSAWFGSAPGGYAWAIVDVDSDGQAAVDLDPADAAWLAQLNVDQAALDTALVELYRLQWELCGLWHKSQLYPQLFPPPDDAPSPDAIATALDPSTQAGVTAAVIAQYAVVNGLFAKVPQPLWTHASSAQEALIAGVAAFATDKGLDANTHVLKPIPNERYYEATNPVVLISGVEPAHDTDPSTALTVRDANHLVTGFAVGSHSIDAAGLGSAIPKLPGKVDALPSAIPALLAEFFLVDPGNAQVIDAAQHIGDVASVRAAIQAHAQASYTGDLPVYGLDAWTQPWAPLFLEWKLDYRHVSQVDGDAQRWTFDGQAYRYTPGASAPTTESREVGGISKLGPSAQFVFKSRLDDYLGKYPNADLSQLETWIEQIDGWKFLGQELVGFHDLLAMQDARAFRRPVQTDTVGSSPSYSVADLAGFSTSSPAGATALPSQHRGRVGSLPYLPNGPTYTFHGVRSGQAYFEYLRLYDKFGRLLWLIEPGSTTGLFDAKNFPLVRDAALVTAADERLPELAAISSVISLPPRVLQHARLDFDLVDAGDQTKRYGHDPSADPIGGWVLPNHLDHSLLLYAAAGEPLGEFRLFAREDGSKAGAWTPPPTGPITTLAQVEAAAPLVHAMITAPELAVQANFEAFLSSVDSTLWTVDPLGNRDDQNLSVLIGRPLALVRARLELSLHGAPIRASDWAHTTLTLTPPPADPEFVGFEFGVRLGDQATRQDGVIGYFTGDDYSTFNSVVAPDTEDGQTYVDPIGPIGSTTAPNFIRLSFASDSREYVSVLVDPRASIHAITGILPIKKVDIPAGLVEGALAQIQVGFVMGPLLTDVQQTPAQGSAAPAHPTAITLPSPVEQGGTWTWYELDTDGSTWTGYDLVAATTTAKLGELPMTLREGVLQLSIDLGEPSKTTGVGGPRVMTMELAVAPEPPTEPPTELTTMTTTTAILEYATSTMPPQLQISSPQTAIQGRVDVSVSSGSGSAKYCAQIQVAIPIGSDAASFSASTPSVAISTSNWSVSASDTVPGSIVGGLDATTYARFTLEARSKSVYELDYNLVFSFTAPVNQVTGSFEILVQELSGTSATSMTPKQASFSLDKVTPFFYLQNFVATTTATPLIPATEFSNGAGIRLAWESNGTWFQLYEKGKTTPIYAGVDTTFTLAAGVATDTTLFLVGSMTSDPSGDTGSFEPIYLYDALTVTVSNPDLTPNSSTIAGTLTVNGPSVLAGGVAAASLAVKGNFSATANATLGPITNDATTFSNFLQTASSQNAVMILTNTVAFDPDGPNHNWASGLLINTKAATDYAIKTNGQIHAGTTSGVAVTTELMTQTGRRMATAPLALRPQLHLSGNAKLKGGKAKIAFGDAADLIASTAPYVVSLTPTSACNGLFVAEKTPQGFGVQELGGGTGDATFDWLVIAAKRHALDKDEPHPLATLGPELRRIDAVTRNEDGAIASVHGRGEYWSPRAVADVVADIESGRYVYTTMPGEGSVHVVERGANKYLRSGPDETPDNNLSNLPDATTST